MPRPFLTERRQTGRQTALWHILPTLVIPTVNLPPQLSKDAFPDSNLLRLEGGTQRRPSALLQTWILWSVLEIHPSGAADPGQLQISPHLSWNFRLESTGIQEELQNSQSYTPTQNLLIKFNSDTVKLIGLSPNTSVLEVVPLWTCLQQKGANSSMCKIVVFWGVWCRMGGQRTVTVSSAFPIKYHQSFLVPQPSHADLDSSSHQTAFIPRMCVLKGAGGMIAHWALFYRSTNPILERDIASQLPPSHFLIQSPGVRNLT